MLKSRILRNSIAVGIALVCSASRLVYGCGHYAWPNSMLDGGDAEALQAPTTRFMTEIDTLIVQLGCEPVTGEYYGWGKQIDEYVAETTEADLRDLRLALCEQGSQDIDRKIREYEKIRSTISSFRCKCDAWQQMRNMIEYYQEHDLELGAGYIQEWRENGLDPRSTQPPRLSIAPLPTWLPAEFAMYLRGAVHYHRGELDEAKKEWSDLLDLPRDQRLYRSTWAAFMIGMCLLEDHPEQSMLWFQRVRELKDQGFKDSLYLAAASIGRQAQAQLRLQNYVSAIKLYLAHYQAAEMSAIPSLRIACRQALLSQTEALQKVAEDPTARKIVTAYILSMSQRQMAETRYIGDGKFEKVNVNATQKWVQAIVAAGISSLDEAPRFAWVAYRAGKYELAQQWLDISDPDDTMTRWIQAKLLLRDGKVRKAAEHLSFLTQRFPPRSDLEEQNWHNGVWCIGGPCFELSIEPAVNRIRGELGLLKLSRNDFEGALHVLLLGQYEEDAAYIAERILTVSELKRYVDKNWKESRERRGYFIRSLLASRLLRLGKPAKARPYFHPHCYEALDEYIAAVNDGRNRKLPDRQRAAAYWKAAQMALDDVSMMISAETEPLWYSHARPAEQLQGPKIRDVHGDPRFLKVTSKERRRTKKHLPELRRELYYRYVAVDHAFNAAQLMPDNDETTAKMLCAAGDWIKHQDPESADRLYKALAIRCRKTELGSQAYKKHWFPKVKIDEREIDTALGIAQ